MTSYNYKNKIGEVPVGELYESVILPNGEEVTVGETIVGWDEPDLDQDIKRDGLRVNSMITTGIVGKIYQRPDGPEISIQGASLGRLPLKSRYLQLPAERPDRFLNSDTNKSIVEYWYDGKYDMETN